MNNEIMRFVNEKFGEIRGVEIDGEPWLVGKDIAKVLGYSNTRDALLNHVDDEDKGGVKYDTLGGSQYMTIINESGLYSLIMSSRLPEAKKVKHWVTSEVLPAIRKTGGYILGEEHMSEEELLLKAFTVLQNKVNLLQEKNKEFEIDITKQQEEIKKLEPKATYLDKILASKDLITVTVIAKDYGMSAKAFNQLLSDNKIQYKVGKQWFLYSEYQDKGYTSSYTSNIQVNGETKVVVAMKWTQQGRLFLYNFLKEQDVVPLIERNLAVQLSLV